MLTFFIYSIIVSRSLFNDTGQTYYVSPSGNDRNTGLSPRNAWKTLEKINQMIIKKGDQILLEGDNVFKGNIQLDDKDAGDAKRKVIISSYGKGKAIIDAGSGTGIFVNNTSGIRISNIIVKGAGVGNNTGSGIHFFADDASKKFSDIILENSEIKGFHFFGILIQSDKEVNLGFSNVQITNCLTSENGEAGIGSLSAYPGIPHRNFKITKCKAFNNRGILTKKDNHSGNGIVLSGVEIFLIDSCEAYENGEDCRSLSGGPVGIWVWHCKKGIIQNSISHNNHSGTCLHDGGGFDLDGGSSGCIIRNCRSYDNEGAGYLVCEFGSPLPFKNNLITNNYSRNDGLKNDYGAITISGAGKKFPVTNTLISNNKIIVDNKNVINGVPAAIYFNNSDCSDIVFSNNSFKIVAGAFVLRSDTLFNPAQSVFKNNRFGINDNQFPVQCLKCGPVNNKFWKEILQKK